MTCVEAFGGAVAVGQAAVGLLRAVRVGGCRRARAHAGRAARRRHPVAARRQARRHRHDDGRVRPGLPLRRLARCGPTPSRSARTSATSRCARRSTSPTTAGRGLFVLTLTSNPEGPSVQHAVRDGATVAASVVAGVARDNATAAASGRLGQRRDGRRRDGRQRGHRPRPRPRRRRRPAAGTRPRRPGRHARGPARDLRCSAAPGARHEQPRGARWPGPTSGRCAMPHGAPPTTWPPPWRAERSRPTCADPRPVRGSSRRGPSR